MSAAVHQAYGDLADAYAADFAVILGAYQHSMESSADAFAAAYPYEATIAAARAATAAELAAIRSRKESQE